MGAGQVGQKGEGGGRAEWVTFGQQILSNRHSLAYPDTAMITAVKCFTGKVQESIFIFIYFFVQLSQPEWSTSRAFVALPVHI
jgi:hypothetical protein